jgi:hypothetical protein
VRPGPRCLHAPPLLRAPAAVTPVARFASVASTLALIELSLLSGLPIRGLAFNDPGAERLVFAAP